jgi:MFS transporter, DHA2 family, methylenomycin A resistance protein
VVPDLWLPPKPAPGRPPNTGDPSGMPISSEMRTPRRQRGAETPGTSAALAAALLGFFVITLDAVIVNVVLPSIRQDLGGGVTGLQWVVDGYTLMFAALLLSAGSLTDRIGARRAFGLGLVVFVLASVACGFAPGLGGLVVARLVQGSAPPSDWCGRRLLG